jgi:NAD(P) transhydrogenase subunit alpha
MDLVTEITLLVTTDAVKRMQPGSVIVDMAGDSGGNCELTKAGETVVEHDVKIISPLNLPSEMPESSSMMYARNIQALVDLMVDDEGKLTLDWSDEVIEKACVAGKQESAPAGAPAATESAEA